MPTFRYIAAVVAVGLAVAVLELIGPSVNGATAAQILLLVLLLDARFCGTGPALVASLAAAVGFGRYFVTPGGFAIGEPNDWAALIAFISMAAVGGELAARAERRAAEAQQQRLQIERLYQQLQAAFDRASEAEAARRNEQLKAALLDALTHNLRTPLTAIKASVTALIGVGAWSGATTLTTEGQRELLQVIDEESDRLNRFIEGLSTSGAGVPEQVSHIGSVALDSVLKAGLARAETLTRDHRVLVTVDDALPNVAIDAASVAEVIYMLLDNASKYAPPGTAIQVTADRESDHYVRVAVTDEGPGIPMHLRERVFEKFFRIPAREPQDPRRVGIGLGLPIARRLIEAQGGKIWIESPPSGRGTTVALMLPVAAADGRDHAAVA